ncbi:WD40 repeat domain-containing protein [Aeoliella mucimassa]|uniref:WD domain, G-beta repeat n=1 Tax=Aeoliella mucimassa TaxID=2527972 RepID=A0A518AH03_9BACT|nr:hypothetical protein [Aeoliella mucimassa]QDU54006.1 WD domain, G-beta repeat [Aeoliella mucimassa]
MVVHRIALMMGMILLTSSAEAQKLVEYRNFEERSSEYGSMAFSPDWKTLYSAGTGSKIKDCDVEANQVIGEFTKNRETFTSVLTVSPDGKWLVAGESNGAIVFYQLPSGEVAKQLDAKRWVRSLAFTADGKELFSGSDDHQIVRWDLEAEQPKEQWPTDKQGYITLSPDGKTAATTGLSRKVSLWDLATTKSVGELKVPAESTYGVAFSADGKWLLSGDRRSPYEVRLWDLATRTAQHEMDGRNDGVVAVAFHPSGKLVAAAKLNGAIEMWSVETGELVDSANSGVSNALGLSFSADGTKLAHVYGATEAACGVRIWLLEGLEEALE